RVPFFQRLIDLTGQTPQKGAIILQRVLFQKIWVPTTWLMIVCALAQPQWVGAPMQTTKSARDLMVAVDLSGSMETTDIDAPDGSKLSRLDAVKQVLAEFASQRKHDRLGLIVFGDSPYLQAPFTEDHATWLTLLDETQISMAGQSTQFGDAIGLAIKIFEGSETQNRVLMVLTDGNDTGSKVPPIEAAKVAADKNITIYSIAVGNPQSIGEQALDMQVMQAIAEHTNGKSYQAADRLQLLQVYQDISQLEPEQYETLSFRPKYDLYHYPMSIVVIGFMLFFAVMTFRSKWIGMRGDHA
ncbi:MAG: VWA domain-containing protein, partial [Gammaproteobacteria bacterium]|nr:VWA domain-containing protein [Gammaproteobacteria bacterium]